MKQLTEKRIDVEKAIGDLPKLFPVKGTSERNISHTSVLNSDVTLHEPRYHNSRDIGIFRNWVENKLNDATSEAKIDYYNATIGKQSNHPKYRNLEWGKPSPTVVAHLNKDGLMFIHPDAKQARSITVREAACLQSFPRDYSFWVAWVSIIK